MAKKKQKTEGPIPPRGIRKPITPQPEDVWPPFSAGESLEGFFARYPGYQSHLNNIEQAVRYGHLAGLALRDRQTQAPVPVVVAVVPDGQGNVEFFPLARLFTGNPYEELVGPGEEDKDA